MKRIDTMKRIVVGAVGFTVVVLLLAPSAAHAHEACRQRSDTLGWYVPDHAKLQTGGQLGLLTVGVGYEAYDIFELDLFYGWVPASVGGTSIHSVAARLSAHVRGLCLSRNVNWIYLGGGIGGVMTLGEGFFLKTPNRFPDSYYPETALRSFLTLGTEVAIRQPDTSILATQGAFIEVTTIDRYVLAWLNNLDTRSFWELWSLSLGYKAGF